MGLHGKGHAWIDDVQFEFVGDDVAPTKPLEDGEPYAQPRPAYGPIGPQNTDFER